MSRAIGIIFNTNNVVRSGLSAHKIHETYASSMAATSGTNGYPTFGVSTSLLPLCDGE